MLPVADEQLVGFEVSVPEITGLGLTTTLDVAVDLHPVNVIVPVTVYEVVDVGLAVTVLPVPALNPVVGVQVYVSAPDAVNVAEDPEQIVAPLTVTTGFGFTVMVNVIGVPLQPLATGVTVIVATMGAFVLFVGLKDAIFPVPLSGKPMLLLLFVQLYIVFGTVDPEKLMGDVAAPAQRV
jgi:hypothetical protein